MTYCQEDMVFRLTRRYGIPLDSTSEQTLVETEISKASIYNNEVIASVGFALLESID